MGEEGDDRAQRSTVIIVGVLVAVGVLLIANISTALPSPPSIEFNWFGDDREQDSEHTITGFECRREADGFWTASGRIRNDGDTSRFYVLDHRLTIGERDSVTEFGVGPVAPMEEMAFAHRLMHLSGSGSIDGQLSCAIDFVDAVFGLNGVGNRHKDIQLLDTTCELRGNVAHLTTSLMGSTGAARVGVGFWDGGSAELLGGDSVNLQLQFDPDVAHSVEFEAPFGADVDDLVCVTSVA